MHTFSETGTGVPAFLAKLWRLVEDSETNDLISWSTDGRSFIIQNQAQFAKELLPLNYKHNNMASFIRQLNMYGFHKITSIDNGGLRFDKDEMEFTHPCFQKDHPYLLEHIKRKIATSKQQQLQQAQQHQQLQDDKSAMKLEAVSRVLSEVKNMRGRQDSLDSRFQTMKQENEALWREIAILRQKHHKQQQIVNKLIHFLVTIVQPSRGGLGTMGNGNNKRRFQLMINEAPQQAKVKKQHDFTDSATIEELGEALEEVAYANQQDLLSKQDKSKKVKVIPVMSGQIVPTSSSVGTTSAVTGKGTSASGANSSAIVRTVNGSSIVKENIAPGVKKAKRNSEIPEISSPMSQQGRSPYRTVTPSLSAGSPTGSVASSTSGGAVYGGNNGGGEDGDLDEEVFSPHGLNSAPSMAKQPRSNRSNGARNNGTNQAPLSLIELIESTVNGADDDEEEAIYGDEDVDQHAAYLVDHVDEVANPEIGAMYQDNGENDMMLNTPMVLREMEKQEQLKQQRERQRQQQQSTGKGGESLLKGVTMATRSGRPQRSVVGQKSLLTARTAAPAVVPMKTGRTVPKSTVAPVAVSKGVKRISVGGSVKKQSLAANNDQPQQIGVAPAGPSNYSGKGQGSSNNSPSPPLAAVVGPSFDSGDVFVTTPADVVPGDIFEDSSDQTMGSGLGVKDGNGNGKRSPMLGSFSLVDGGFYNPNVNMNEMKASLQRQQLQGQQGVQQGGVQQVPTAIGDGLDNGETHDDEFDENSLDSNMMLNQATGNQQHQDQQQQQQLQLQMQPQQQDQQLSKFVSNDADMSRLNTVAEYGQHIDTVQNDLDSLRELLKGDNYQMDANALLGLFNNNNEDMLNYDFPMNLPDLMTDEQQQQHQQQQLQQQQQGSNEKSTTSDSPAPGGQIMAYRKGNSNGNLYNNNGAIGLNGLAHNDTNDASGLLGGNNLIGTDGTIVSGDYIDLNELLNMDPNPGAYYSDENSLVA
ncbi:uncharacterized protein LOC131205732 isoform X2 [Anopheles bellator]|uniref:uncharacterized protein LOC131205732 isoform X2 n=1 Tax=Anopheles bellator TaxID=139047 RepID=UPI002649CF85|nr:uncharacterized protein LOC131205732 isoform X2 [Anopheles bellator]